jgi:hypothetical protein
VEKKERNTRLVDRRQRLVESEANTVRNQKQAKRADKMGITKKQLVRIITEEYQNLISESVSDTEKMQEEISSASFAIATEFQESKYVGRSRTDWNMRVYDAGNKLEKRIRNEIVIAIKEIENELGDPNK